MAQVLISGANHAAPTVRSTGCLRPPRTSTASFARGGERGVTPAWLTMDDVRYG